MLQVSHIAEFFIQMAIIACNQADFENQQNEHIIQFYQFRGALLASFTY